MLVDNRPMEIAALDETDRRRLDVLVAGPAGLLVAKLHKIADRQGARRRQDDKDALDVYRLLQAVPTEDLAAGVSRLLAADVSGTVTRQALGHLEALFGTPRAPGSEMAGRAVELVGDPALTAASVAALAGDLLAALR